MITFAVFFRKSNKLKNIYKELKIKRHEKAQFLCWSVNFTAVHN